jgi:four helix bundle protein
MIHTELTVWKESLELLVKTYNFTEKLPRGERYRFINQMNRAALSIPSNIAEGAARGSTKDYIRFLNTAFGSAAELETQYYASQKLKIIGKEAHYLEQVVLVMKLLSGQIRALKKKLIRA